MEHPKRFLHADAPSHQSPSSPLHLLDALLLEDVSVVLDLGHRRLLLRLDHGALPVSLGLLKLQMKFVN